MSKRFVMLETQPQVELVHEYLRHFISVNPAAGLPVANKTTALKVVFSLVENLLIGRSAFEDEYNLDVKVAAAIYGLAETGLKDKHFKTAQLFMDNPLFDGIIQDLDTQLDPHIERRTYTIWKVIQFAGVIGIAEGEDHRISEYYRLTDQNNGDDNAVLALNCQNLVSFLMTEFIKSFNAVLSDPRTAQRIAALYSNDEKQMLRMLNELAHPYRQVIALFLDTLTTMYPMVELAPECPQLNEDFFAVIGLININEFKQNYVRKVIAAFGLSYFSAYLKKDKRYLLEYSAANIMALYEQTITNKTEKDMHQLLQSLINGDYLPPEERAIAERLYQESNR
ncbi:hypothetical protein AVT69_gp040 [Pseudomonas phage PhiPA3]|uniref:Uncharacterized protein 039 n=1 Tax=Pseudomonas phage PhiPA3 TaxID=998086 RepID=F8SJS1_BPPA3|nr:hypothetical protein AVT69_gp040 [Pseudomonas phage PhiPA3]AEH03466.1 hypothetical protein [Pseudomonas phage PhiPA3]